MKTLAWLLLLTFLLSVLPLLAQWTEPVLFGVEHGNAIRTPWLSNDGLRMYAAFSGYIFVSERARADSAWTPFHTVGNHVNGAQRQESPCESPSGDTLYFMAEGREPTYGWYDMYYTVRTDSGWWGPIVNCGPNINSQWMEWTVGISRDGSKLIVSSDRIPGGTLNLYLSDKLEDGTWGPLVNCGPGVNTWVWEEHGTLSLDNRRLYFYRDGQRMGDIWMSDLRNGVWSTAEHLPEPVTTLTREESDPCLAADGRTLYFISDRSERYHRQLYVTVDTTVTSSVPHVEPLPLAIEPALFGFVEEQSLHLTVVGHSRGGTYPVQVFNVLGQLIADHWIELTVTDYALKGRLPLTELPSGTYLIHLNYPTANLTSRFSIVR